VARTGREFHESGDGGTQTLNDDRFKMLGHWL
jgi:hypothetical protein